MDYLETLLRFRNDMHRDIVQEETVKTFHLHDGNPAELIFRVPFSTDNPYGGELYVVGVDCMTGNLISENNDGNRNSLRYLHLTIEELATIHKVITTKDYTINQLV